MKRCLECQTLFPMNSETCPECGYRPIDVDGFHAYAPALAHEGGGFKASYFEDLAALEGENFWFRARNRLILWALRKYCSQFHSLLEIGCGTGYVLSGIARAFPQASIYGTEIFTNGLRFSADRVPGAQLMQMDARHVPFSEAFDVVGAFDVIEHIEEDTRVMAQVHAALKPGGYFLLTVPQHAWLWSAVDEYACHVRRYSASELHDKLRSNGFEIVRSTSFVSILLPAMLAFRLARKKSVEDISGEAELKISPMLNVLFGALMHLETLFIGASGNFFAGGSRLVIAKRTL
ncbi:methyltransferase domain-containing protein [Pandoraea sp. CB10b_02]|uniref:methyltransferase domain-containing protein n=1 Tax=Pandoraea sp. CB10b_02 TaxID=2014535 RepID=UPI002580D141|nr:methyltransferase domain-containing protein [Pandoraea sp. CB10b_02]